MKKISPFRTQMTRCVRSFWQTFDRLWQEEPFLEVAKVFRLVFLGWIALHTILLLPYAESIWGVHAYKVQLPFRGDLWINWIMRPLTLPAVIPYYPLFIAGQLLSVALGIFGIQTRLMIILVWFFTVNLNSHAGVILDGGNNLSELLLFYFIFIKSSGKSLTSRLPPIPRAFFISCSNIFFILAQLQVVAVYLTAGILKLNGSLWQSGMALYYIFQSADYSHPVWGAFFVKHYELSIIGTYFTLAFQFIFPTLVWFRRTKPMVFAAGILLHLGIAMLMGLLTFGLIMGISYILFFPRTWAQRILALRPATAIVVIIPRRSLLSTILGWSIRLLNWYGLITVRFTNEPGEPAGQHLIPAIASRIPLLLPFFLARRALAYFGWEKTLHTVEIPNQMIQDWRYS